MPLCVIRTFPFIKRFLIHPKKCSDLWNIIENVRSILKHFKTVSPSTSGYFCTLGANARLHNNNEFNSDFNFWMDFLI